MELTPETLIAELQALGYPTTARKLTDWTAKGLLPPLRHQGLGRSRGSVYYWEQPDILNQAVAIHDLLERYGWAKRLYVPLWLMGFEVSIEKLRERLLQEFDSAITDICHGSEENDLEYALWDVAYEQARRHRKRGEPFVEPAFLWLGAMFDPEREPSDQDIEEVIRHPERLGYAVSAKPSNTDIEQQKWLWKVGHAFARQHLSIPRLREVVRDATEEEFKQVQLDSCRLWELVREVFTVIYSADDLQGVEHPLHPLRGGNSLGQWVALADLSLRQAGFGPRIERWLRVGTVYGRRVLSSRRFREEVLNPLAAARTTSDD